MTLVQLRFAAVALAAAMALLALPAPAVVAGTPDSPDIEDASGDVAVDAGPLVLDGADFAGADLVAAWFDAEPRDENVAGFDVNVELAGPMDETGELAISFQVEKGPTSFHNSTASGARRNVVVNDAGATGLSGVVFGMDGNVVTVTIPWASAGARGGDRLTNLTVAATATSAGTLPLEQDDESASDRMPDEGNTGSTPFTLPRVPVKGGVSLRIVGLAAPGPAQFAASGTTSTLTTDTSDGVVRLTVEATNTGTDDDTVTLLTTSSGIGVASAVSPVRAELLPGQSAQSTWSITLTGAHGDYTLGLVASTTRGASAQASLALVAPAAAAPPEERSPSPGGLAFLTPMAEAVGFDSVFGDYAELVLLALLVLLLVLLVFLLLTLARRPWVKVRVAPRTLSAPPGSTVEAKLAIVNAKRQAREAFASFRNVGAAWKAGLLLRQSQGAPRAPVTNPGERIEIEMTGKYEEGDHYDGRLRVKVPEDARPGEEAKVEVDVVPVDHRGEPRTAHMAKATVTVRAAEAPALSIKLEGVRHEPSDPEPGTPMRSTAVLRNEAPATAALRVVLNLDGRDVVEERVEVPPRASRAVVLPWTAGAGRNQVKVQVFPA